MTKLLFLLFPILCFAQLSLEELEKSPKGHVRNFHIWQYMQGEISPEDADRAYALVEGSNTKIFKRYAKKTKKHEIIEKYRCSRLNTKAILQETNPSCVNEGLSFIEAMELSPSQRVKVSLLLAEQYPSKSALVRIMNEKPFILSLLKSGCDNYLKLFNTLGYTYRQRYFNVKLSAERINELSRYKGFERMIKYTVTDAKMKRMQEALLSLKPSELSSRSYFFLALNALKFKATKKASHYLEIAHNKAYYQMDRDKASFWLYMITKDKNYLQELSLSSDINIYTLYAREKLGLKVDNYFSVLPLNPQDSRHDLQNPYVWEELLDRIRSYDTQGLMKLRKEFNGKDDEVVNAFIYSKALKYKQHNYIMPYSEATQTLSNDDKALIYALARQESHFIPSAISRSYALGVMQMMPFLIKALAKQKKEEVELNEMFDPYKNIAYARHHILYLQKHLYHPLFIAYAYNGGIGFTKRHLLKNTFLQGSYEPYLSMELMANTESREYGKKVLANYVIYKKILGEEVKITSLLERLTQPSHTDRFRKRVVVLNP